MIFQGDDTFSPGFSWPENGFWILARESTLYQRVSLTGIPKNSRAKVLAQKIRQLSPFDKTGKFIVEESEEAMIWLWDENIRSQAVLEMEERHPDLGSYFSELVTIPETVLLPRQLDGSFETRTVNGEEAQSWDNSILVSSTWRPASADSPLALRNPWASFDTTAPLLNEALWWRLGLLVLFLLIMLQLGNMSGLAGQQWILEKRNVDAREEASSLLALRSRVQRIRADNQQLLEWLHHPSQLNALADFDELFQETAEINRWEYKTGELSATISDKKINNRRFIESLSKGEHFHNVRVEPGARLGTVVISLEVRP